EIRLVGRTRLIVADDVKRTRPRAARERIVERERLKRGAELVIPVGPRAEQMQRQVDLRERAHANGARHCVANGPDRRSSSSVIGTADAGICTRKTSASRATLVSTCESASRRSNGAAPLLVRRIVRGRLFWKSRKSARQRRPSSLRAVTATRRHGALSCSRRRYSSPSWLVGTTRQSAPNARACADSAAPPAAHPVINSRRSDASSGTPAT